MSLKNVAEQLEKLVSKDFSGVISIGLCEGCLITKAFGLAYRPGRVPNSEQTRFAIASGTKGFTALAILKLIQEGRLSFSTTLCDVIPGLFPEHNKQISIRHLLTHRSGIPDYCDEDAGCDYESLWSERPVYSITKPKDFLPMFAYNPMKTAPGSEFSYSNSGYILLGLIIEAVTGRTYAEYVQSEVFQPLGMERAGFFRSDMLPEDTATGYISRADGSWRSNIFSVPVIGAPDGGAFVNAADMHALWKGLLSSKLIYGQTLEELLQTEIPANSPSGFLYSLGFWVAPSWANQKYLFLMGSDPGVSFMSGVCPASGVHFSILSNVDNEAFRVSPSVIDLLGCCAEAKRGASS